MNEYIMLLYRLANILFKMLAEAKAEIASLEDHVDKMRLHADELAIQRDDQRDRANRLERELAQ